MTTSWVLEAAARYQWAYRWQAGLVINDFLNQGSAYRASQGDAHFAGVQALKEFDLGRQWLARAGARAMTEINNTGTAASSSCPPSSLHASRQWQTAGVLFSGA